jgi:hypothetical protein
MRPARFVSATVGIAVVALTGLQAWAEAPTDQVKAAVDRIVAILQDPALSLVANYRTQFDKIIQTSSYRNPIRRIRVQSRND